jgi:hypothetical protein
LLVVAVDGVLADTLAARQHALVEGALAVALVDSVPSLPDGWIAGRSWSEAVRQLPGVASEDLTLLDLASHAAERLWSEQVASRPPVFDMKRVARCRLAVSSGCRLILRADSTRRSLSATFSFLEEETGASRTVTGDDPGVLSASSVLLSQYAAIITVASANKTVYSVEDQTLWMRLEKVLGRYAHRGWPA